MKIIPMEEEEIKDTTYYRRLQQHTIEQINRNFKDSE